MQRVLAFPKGFLWGTATAGHQVEGHNSASDWWRFEAEAGAIADRTRSGNAVDYWNRFEDDHALMEELGYGAFRLGVEWAKVEPVRGVYDRAALERYRTILVSLQRRGIRVCLTLWHWVLPQWVAERGGFEDPRTLAAFFGYVREVARVLGPFVDLWVTLNEPMAHVLFGYVFRFFPPQKSSLPAASRVAHALLRAHVGAVQVLREELAPRPEGPAPIGVAQAYPWHAPWGSFGPLGWLEGGIADLLNHAAWGAFDEALREGRLGLPWGRPGAPALAGLAGSVDFCGVNQYFRTSVKLGPDALRRDATTQMGPIPDGVERTEMGWQIYPPALFHVLETVWRRFRKPIHITENGIADSRDAQRPRYLLTHLAQVHRALCEGIDVRGYFHWSFIDNFEWREGFSKRFGLVACDHDDPALVRRPRESARLYGEIARGNAITEDMVARYAPGAEAEVFGPRWRC